MIGDEAAELKGKSWEDLSQSFYPLKYVRKMLTQVRKIQESVRAEGMKPDERSDWTGVKMHLVRIFEQEQFIMRKGAKSTPTAPTGYRSPTDYAYFEGTKEPNAIVKRFIFKFKANFQFRYWNGDTVNKRYKETYLRNPSNYKKLVEKAHCLKLVHLQSDDVYTGFIQLKEYAELSEVAELLGAALTCFPQFAAPGPANPKHYNKELKESLKKCTLEACEVRGKTNEIFNGKGKVKIGSKDGKAKWGEDMIWSEYSKQYGRQIFSYQDDNTYDDTPCFNLVSGIMQAKEELQQRVEIRNLHDTVNAMVNLLRKQGMMGDETDSDTASLFSYQSRREGEERIVPSAPLPSSVDGPELTG